MVVEGTGSNIASIVRCNESLQELAEASPPLVARLDRLERRLSACLSLAPQDRDPVIAYVVIESLNAWSQFSKAYYLSCILAATTHAKVKVVVTPHGMSMNDALGLAVLKYKKHATPNSSGEWARRDEPAWHDPNVLLTVCQNVSCSIHSQMQAAFSMGQQVFLDLPVFRNFYGHRNRMSCRAAQISARNTCCPQTSDRRKCFSRAKPMAAGSLLEEWLAEMKITAEFLCE